MLPKLVPLIFKNLIRSRTRFFATIGGCVIAGFVVCFFLAAKSSLAQMLTARTEAATLLVSQKDRW